MLQWAKVASFGNIVVGACSRDDTPSYVVFFVMGFMRNTLDFFFNLFFIVIFIVQNVYLGIFIYRKGSVITANSLFDMISGAVYSKTEHCFTLACVL